MFVWTARVLVMVRKPGNFFSNVSEATRQPVVARSFLRRCLMQWYWTIFHRYERIEVQESFNPADNFVELRQPLTNFEECCRQRVDVEEDQHVARSANNASHQFGIHSSNKSHPRRIFSKSSSSKLCFVCNKSGHLASSCYQEGQSCM